jgi:hypothetical protein
VPKGCSAPTVFCVFLFILSACSGEVQLYDPDQTPQDSVPGDVQKATLTLTFRIAIEDSTVSLALGWPEGAVPDAEVTLSRAGSIEELTGMTDAAGGITFEELLPGSYRASAIRLLTEEERALLTEPDRDVNALGGGGTFNVAAPETEKTLSLAAGRPRSVVISEMSDQYEPEDGGGYYDWGHYLELYNNSDTTIYLDQKLIGSAFSQTYDNPNWPCVDYEQWTNDPAGVWVMFLFQFPGTGRQYPLMPGDIAVIATDAIDHREFGEGAVDLSGADFEFIGTADVDNPGAANLVSVGPRPCCLGHGLVFFGTSDVVIVADPVDLDAIPKEIPTGHTYWIWRIPVDKVLDVGAFRHVIAGNTPCPQLVHERFDRQESTALGSGDHYYSYQRPVLYRLPNGRAVLQHTRTSARDFVKLRRNPGELP